MATTKNSTAPLDDKPMGSNRKVFGSLKDSNSGYERVIVYIRKDKQGGSYGLGTTNGLGEYLDDCLSDTMYDGDLKDYLLISEETTKEQYEAFLAANPK